mmetsp:Transcript_24851/g.44217  ORF Transcript_24851/g.44217 Transcript_24851/m.44217 type:complete len:349 (-) Transcript_24851:99-1145(-)|eukprot:CAMPEP_0197526738 /NCGR_PEP_ID=MMETSP1318-20131121/19139_1 /TAXON_ID=552666 /ORGANISM="Partenskyella glossopodia, Strain RCC365" /LENGTH=348 /DNA_ID=CAMNT_0043081053 /DNA_START=70 /DNA_END=1119 /DNA_ORIENTATION=-
MTAAANGNGVAAAGAEEGPATTRTRQLQQLQQQQQRLKNITTPPQSIEMESPSSSTGSDFGEANPLQRALNKGMQAGMSGSAAMSAQITTFMWLHTIMRYQYRHGTSTIDTFRMLYRQGGVLRFYRGYSFAILNAPIIRFGSTAANQSSLTFLDSVNGNIPLWAKTVCSAAVAALWKIMFTPLDMMQTTFQVGGDGGQNDVRAKVRKHGIKIFWHGSSAMYASALVGNFSWFAVYNTLNARWSNYEGNRITQTARDGAIGILSTFTSDLSTNFLEVLKTHRQTTRHSVGYSQAFSEIVGREGLVGLATRGLRVRLAMNCLQGAFFTIVWNSLQRNYFSSKQSDDDDES